MRQLAALIIIIITGVISVNSQTIELKGEQIKKSDHEKAVLKCTPVKITKSMKITKAEGNCNGFWIEKGSETIHKFENLTEPIGTVLSPGIYYIYPYMKEKTEVSDISVTLKHYNSG